ncbi:Membrane-bound lysozyme inhibitor of C-type lysozyme [Mixta theicola]|nr:MliC family protein [Mixta theicola]QHM75610.1 Membrane-bound lysozyme inhibitor of C-type lysozyme [Mixta theicola]
MRKKLVLLAVVLLSGCGLHGARQEREQVRHYLCGTLPLTVTFSGRQAQFIMDGQLLKLPRQATASGALYGDETWRLRITGASASLERHQRIVVADCQQQTQG